MPGSACVLSLCDRSEGRETTAAEDVAHGSGREFGGIGIGRVVGGSELLDQASRPFVGRWNQLVSDTNWEKGRIIQQWREALR